MAKARLLTEKLLTTYTLSLGDEFAKHFFGQGWPIVWKLLNIRSIRTCGEFAKHESAKRQQKDLRAEIAQHE